MQSNVLLTSILSTCNTLLCSTTYAMTAKSVNVAASVTGLATH